MSFYNGILNHDDIHGSGQIGPRGLPGIGFKVDVDGNYDIENKKLTNVKNGDMDHDVMVKSQIEGYVSNKTQYLDGALPAQVTNNKAVIYSNSGSIHGKALYLKDQYDQEVHFFTEDQDLNQCRLYVPNLKNNDSYGGRKKSSLMITSIDQTIQGKKIFHDIEVPNPTTNSQAVSKYYVDHNFLNRLTGGQIGGDLDMRGHSIKYLKLDNSDSAAARVAELNLKLNRSRGAITGDLVLQKKYQYPIPGDLKKVINYENIREIFLSRKESFPMNVDLNINNHLIQNVKDPVNADNGVNKKYVDNQMGIKADLSKTTTQTFQGRVQVPDFNQSAHSGSDIVNLRYIDGIFLNKNTGGTLSNPITFLSSLPNNQKQIHNLGLPQFKSSATNKQYVDSEISKISGASDTSQFIRKDGSVSMTGNLDLGMNKISNLKLPTNDTDAANKIYIDKTLSESHLIASSKKNEFTYLGDPDDTSSEYNITVNGFIDFNQSPHKNKKAYSITLQKDAGTNNYRSRMGFNLYPLPLGAYTMIFEFFPPTITNIQLSVQASEAYIHKSVQKDFSNYSKMLVQITPDKITPDYIYLTMHGTSTTSPVNAYLIVYGIKNWSDNVTPEIYDHQIFEEMFEYDNGDMKMNTDLDMNNNKIENLDDPLNEGDACNKRSLNIVETKINDLSHYTKDYIYRTIFENDFYDLEETSMFNLVQGVSGVVISSLRPNLVLGTDRFINSYSPKYGLQLSTKSHIRTTKIFNQNTSFTFFMSFLHDTTKICEISWSNTLNIHVKFYPRYQITNNKLIIEVPSKNYETTFTSDFQNKQNFVWICYDASKNLHKFSLGNYSSRVQQTFAAPVNFQSRQLEIDYDGYVKKIGLIDKFIDIDSLEFHKIILEEKRNGAYLE